MRHYQYTVRWWTQECVCVCVASSVSPADVGGAPDSLVRGRVDAEGERDEEPSMLVE